jgi:thioredoxin 2
MSLAASDDRGIIETCPNCGQKNRIPFSGISGSARCGNCKRDLPPLSATVKVPDEEAFDALVGSSPVPVLVDFWAPWCGPCKMMAPELERVAARADGRFVVAKVNTEEIQSLGQRFQVNAIPTLAVFAKGEEIGRSQGFRPAAQIEQFVAGQISK